MRVTLGDSTVVGEVVFVGNSGVDVRPDGAEDANIFSTPPWTVDLLPEPVPAWMLEPGAVCQGVSGDAWQRFESGDWYSDGALPLSAVDLIAQRGPLTRLVPVPVVPEDVQEAARGLVEDGGFPDDVARVARWVLDLAGQA